MIKWFMVYGLWFMVFTLSPVLAHSEIKIVEMIPDGFKPESVTIDTNSTIIFKNSDKNSRWPASNIHPTHELYPEFDPKQAIEPGKDWTFKPKKAGIFKFHDHLFPHLRGILTVEAEPGSNIQASKPPPLPNLIDKLRNTISMIFSKIAPLFNTKEERILKIPDLNKLSSDEQLKSLEDYAKTEGAEKGWELIKNTFKNQAGSSGNVHDLAHLSGSLLFKQKGFPAITSCTTQFAFGCYHGFLDTAFSENLDHLSQAFDACQKLGKENTGPVASCIHGIGHGVASYYSTSNLKASLAECRKLIRGKEYCFDGVFMEFVRNAPESFFKRDDPLYPCNELEANFGPIYTFSCGRNQPSLMMSRFKMGFDEVTSVCLSAKSESFKQACFDSLGFSLASTQDENQIILGCQKINEPEYVLRCAKAAAGELIFQEVPGWEEKSEAICNYFQQGQEDCKAHLDRIIKEYGRVKKITFNLIKEGEDPGNYLRYEIKKCYAEGGRDGCYKEVAKVFYEGLGLKTSLNLLKSNEQYPQVYARCHEGYPLSFQVRV